MNNDTALIKHTPQENNMLAVIDRAARDPGTDVAKMERLLALAEKMQERASKAEYDQALSAAQSEMRPISRDCHNPQTRSRYASYEAIDSAIRPIYTQHGFAMFFGSKPSPNPAEVIVTCRVSHRAGHSETIELPMPADGKGAKGNDVMTRTHATGSALSYGQRYLAKLVWNLSFGEADDDGNAASPRHQAAPRPAPEPEPAQPLPAAPKAPPSAEKLRARLLVNLAEFGEKLNDYTLAVMGCDPQEWPEENLPRTKEEMESLKTEIEHWLMKQADLIPADDKKVSTMVDTKEDNHKESFWSAIITVPRAGMKRDDYLKAPDTIRSLYDAMKAGDGKARTRLWGLVSEWQPGPRVIDGKETPPAETDLQCRKALDEFQAWHEKNKK